MKLLALDPGTDETGFVLFDGERVEQSGVARNPDVFALLELAPVGAQLAIEMVASYGMPVGREVFETCVWIGRFQQAWREPDAVCLVYRRDVKLHLCGSARAKDANIRAALLDRFGPGKDKAVGRKAAPGPLYGVASHAWAALGVAVTAAECRA